MTPKEEIVQIYTRNLMRKVDRQDGFPLMREEIEKLFHAALDDYRESLHVPQYDKELRLAEGAVAEANAAKEKAERLTQGIKREARGYRNDHLKAVNWLCDNGFGESCGNPTEDIIKLLGLARAKNLSQAEYISECQAELNEVIGYAACHGWKSTRYEIGKKLREEIGIISAAEEALKKCL